MQPAFEERFLRDSWVRGWQGFYSDFDSIGHILPLMREYKYHLGGSEWWVVWDFPSPPSMKYLCAKIIVLNDNKTTKNVSDVFFFFSCLGKKKKSVYPPMMERQLGKVEWTGSWEFLFLFQALTDQVTDQLYVLGQVPSLLVRSVSMSWGRTGFTVGRIHSLSCLFTWIPI